MTTFDSTKASLTDLLREITEGKIQLPDFQRGWVWDDDHIRDLLVSIGRSFPIGAVMLLYSLAIGRVADHIDNLGRNLFHRMRRGAARHTVGQGRRVIYDFALGDIVPDRQQDLLSRHRPGN